ncbi:hypothetical protein [Pseudoxanthomonas gei]|uniref:hypothetical protein n=1 Tax=Pseudoxanthomonas gei TaxID=1383030 RepID=UPI001391C008|nr:hypothetical protein [Pseudoxanthomonas gei]
MKWVASLFVFLLAFNARAEVDFMGLKLGAPIASVPECAYVSASYNQRTYLGFDAGPCWRSGAMRPTEELSKAKVFKVFYSAPKDKKPEGIKWTQVLVVDGKVAGILATTDGAIHKDELLALLLEKYGSPSTGAPARNSEELRQRRLDRLKVAREGRTFVENVEWLNLGGTGIRVTFTAVEKKSGYGSIEVFTPTGDDHISVVKPLEPTF